MPKSLKILMLCWEYPPLITGGLGNAAAGLAQGLAQQGHQVDVLLPNIEPQHKKEENPKLLDVSQTVLDDKLWVEDSEMVEMVREFSIGYSLVPYLPPQFFRKEEVKKRTTSRKNESNELSSIEAIEIHGGYGHQLMAEIQKYALLACQVAKEGEYHVIHVNDWMTFRAGILIQKVTDIPVVFHVHSVESDRNGAGRNAEIEQIEHESLIHAKYVVAVSKRLRNQITTDYGIASQKIEVVPNGVSGKWGKPKPIGKTLTVGFVGRLTHQKGPSYFLDIARELRSRFPDIRFFVIGDGYLREALEEKAQRLNLSVVFTGFLEGKSLSDARNKLDLLVAPSISEPFGLVILEALQNGIPVVTSPNTGIAEIITDLPQIKPWDTFTLARQCEQLLSQEKTRNVLLESCQREGKTLTWEESADKMATLYNRIIS